MRIEAPQRQKKCTPGRRASVKLIALFLMAFLSLASHAQDYMRFPARGKVPAGYPAEYAATITAAENEANLVIYSTTDLSVARNLIEDFQTLYPRIEVEYHDLNSTVLHYRFQSEMRLGQSSADIVWSSAMDQQFSLVDQGFAQGYASPETAALPAWVVWQNLAFGTSFEPVAIVFNKRLLAENLVPRTHADLLRLLNSRAAEFTRRIVTYDIEKSGLGFLLASQDATASPEFWDVARALGKVEARFDLTSEGMIKSVVSGRNILAYNALGSYALKAAATEPAIGVVFPADYTLVMSRIAFISSKARNPNAARLWIDYLLSRRGQTLLANQAGLHSVRGDIEGPYTASTLKTQLGASIRPIPVAPGLVADLAEPRYRDFIRRWRQATSRK